MSQVAGPVSKAVSRAKRLVILGGGMSGLCFLHYLRNFAFALNKRAHISKVTLVEANNYMGGSVKSQIFDDGQVHELGPRSIRSSGVRAKNTICLMDELGLSDKVLQVTDKSSAGRDRYIYHNNQLFNVPSSITKLFKKLPNSQSTLFQAVSRDLFKAPSMELDQYPHQDPSIYDFIAHRFGQEAAENMADPILRGITAGDCRQLSTKSMLEDIYLKEQVYGSVIKGIFKPPLISTPHDNLFPREVLKSKLIENFTKSHTISYNLSTGLQTVPEHLSNSLLNTNEDGLISIYNSTRAVSIGFNFDGKFERNEDDGEVERSPCNVEVETVDGDRISIDADHVVASLPAKNLCEIIPDSMRKEHREALENIYKIPHAPVGCVTVEYRGLDKKKLPKVVESFGFLTHSKAGSRVLGIAFDSSMFPSIDKPLNSTRMTCMIGGAWFEEVLGTSDPNQVSNTQLEQIALEEIRKILKIEEEPFRISSWMWKTGIAQYTVGHKDRLVETRKKINELGMPLTLLGQSYDGVAINDVTFTARMAAWNFVESL